MKWSDVGFKDDTGKEKKCNASDIVAWIQPPPHACDIATIAPSDEQP